MTLATEQQKAPAGFVEKTPLEAYVAPAKPSLVGLSRAQLADVFGELGVPRRSARCAPSSSGTGPISAA